MRQNNGIIQFAPLKKFNSLVSLVDVRHINDAVHAR